MLFIHLEDSAQWYINWMGSGRLTNITSLRSTIVPAAGASRPSNWYPGFTKKQINVVIWFWLVVLRVLNMDVWCIWWYETAVVYTLLLWELCFFLSLRCWFKWCLFYFVCFMRDFVWWMASGILLAIINEFDSDTCFVFTTRKSQETWNTSPIRLGYLMMYHYKLKCLDPYISHYWRNSEARYGARLGTSGGWDVGSRGELVS